MKREFQIQAEIIVWFRNEYTRKGLGLIFSVPNEATYTNKNFKTTGVLTGVSDLIVILQGQVIFVEVKNDVNTQSIAQKNFETSVISLGQKYFVIRSLNDFKQIFV
jgi:hypothetical protein